MRGDINRRGSQVIVKLFDLPIGGKWWTTEFSSSMSDELCAGLFEEKLLHLIHDHMRKVRYTAYCQGIRDGLKQAKNPKSKMKDVDDFGGCFDE
jgi:hypothetical protein